MNRITRPLRQAFANDPNQNVVRQRGCRLLTTPSPEPQNSTTSLNPTSSSPNTHYKITLMRSPISLGDRIKGTLVSLGIHRRMQTVYHPHSPEFAGKILAVKELVKVENVPAAAVRTKTEQRRERKASRGFVVVKRAGETGGLEDADFARSSESQGRLLYFS